MLRSTQCPFEERWLIDQVGEVEGLVVAMEPVTAGVLEAASKSRIIARPGVGYITVDIEFASLNFPIMAGRFRPSMNLNSGVMNDGVWNVELTSCRSRHAAPKSPSVTPA